MHAFFGRQEALRELERSVAAHRLVTVTGAAGMGKTRLVRELIAWRTDRVAFCALASANRSSELIAAMASALGRPIAGARELGPSIARAGIELIILDNLEQLLPSAAETIASLLAETAGVAFLVTSRRRLGVRGEQVLPLPPLSEGDAVDLFLDRARRLRPDLLESGAVKELVRRLDGLPLAIELAAGRSLTSTPEELLDRLQDRFRLLSRAGPQSDPHGSLLGALDCSWNLLSPVEQRVLARCSVFAGGFSLDAAAEVVDLDRTELIEILEHLTECSLIEPSTSVALPGRTRFHLFESVREHARLRGSIASAEARHAETFAAIGSRLVSEIDGPHARRARAELLDERANLMAVVECERALPQQIARAALALDAILSSHGPLALRMAALEQACARLSELAIADRIELLSARGWAKAHGGKPREGIADLQAALGLALDPSHRASEAEISSRIGHLHLRLGETALARPRIERAVALCEEKALGAVEGRALDRLGLLHLFEGDAERAEEALTRALEAHRRHGNLLGLGYSHCNRGSARQELGLLDRAQDDFERALELQLQLGDQRLLGVARVSLGLIELERGASERAEAAIGEGLRALRRTSHLRAEAEALEVLGFVAIARDRGAARRFFAEAEELYATFGCSPGRAGAAAGLAACSALAGRIDEARAGFDRARREIESLAATDEEQRLIEVLRLLIDPGARIEPRERSQRHPASGRPARALLRLAVQLVTARGRRRQELAIDEHYRWFKIDGGSQISLHRRGPMRSILKALVENQRRSPGRTLDVHQLFDAGWPGQNIRPDIGAARVYESIRVLRKLGLEGLLVHEDGGYRLEPEVQIYSNATS